MKTLFTTLPLLFVLAACTTHGQTEPAPSAQMTDVQAEEREVWQQSDRRIQPGAFAPQILLPTLFRSQKQLAASLDGTDHIVLFWASWCKDCQREMPALIRWQKQHRNIPWITVSLDNEAEKARTYLHKHPLQGIHLFDGRDWRGEACTDYAVPLHGIPYLIYIDKQGRILALAGTIKELEKALEQHKKATADTAP